MRRAVAKVPGSCGEFIQGIVDSRPCLVSCPIDMYATCEVTAGKPAKWLPRKAAAIFEQIFREYHLPASEKQQINVRLSSRIPRGKGMASSTADMAAVAAALSAYFDLGLTADDIATLCVAVEPTDNIMYPELNLYDFVDGGVMRRYHTTVHAGIVIVDFGGSVSTVGFRGQREIYDKDDIAAFSRIISQFEDGLGQHDLDKIGAACTASAKLNQKVLEKPQLEPMIQLCKAYDGAGIVIGHSGTVAGVLYNEEKEEKFDAAGFMNAWRSEVSGAEKMKIYRRHVIPGGIAVSVGGHTETQPQFL